MLNKGRIPYDNILNFNTNSSLTLKGKFNNYKFNITRLHSEKDLFSEFTFLSNFNNLNINFKSNIEDSFLEFHNNYLNFKFFKFLKNFTFFGKYNLNYNIFKNLNHNILFKYDFKLNDSNIIIFDSIISFKNFSFRSINQFLNDKKTFLNTDLMIKFNIKDFFSSFHYYLNENIFGIILTSKIFKNYYGCSLIHKPDEIILKFGTQFNFEKSKFLLSLTNFNILSLKSKFYPINNSKIHIWINLPFFSNSIPQIGSYISIDYNDLNSLINNDLFK